MMISRRGFLEGVAALFLVGVSAQMLPFPQVVSNSEAGRQLYFENFLREGGKGSDKGVGTTGGFLVPTEFQADLHDVMAKWQSKPRRDR
jgi:hypothetical protein